MQAVCLAFDFARASAGNNSAAKMAIMAMTTNNSIKVNASLARLPQREPGHTPNPFPNVPEVCREPDRWVFIPPLA
jgi:hypothetical protein